MRFDPFLVKKTFNTIHNMFVGITDDAELTDNNPDQFLIKFSDDIRDWLELKYNNVLCAGCGVFYNITDNRVTERNLIANMTVTDINIFKEALKKTAELINMTNKLPLEIVNKELYDELERLEATKIDRSKVEINCPLKDLSNDKTNIELKTLLVAAEYPTDVCKEIYNLAQTNREFILNDFKDFPVYNNRLFIPITDVDKKIMKASVHGKINGSEMNDFISIVDKCNYIVISKNPIDYFYASYGNSFQSCFALNSQYNALYGTIPLCRAKSHFMVYATSGKVTDVSLVSGKKFHCPQMFWRSWGYADKNCDLILDKYYRSKSTAIDTFIGQCISMLQKDYKVYADKYNNTVRELYEKGHELGQYYTRRFTYFDGLKWDGGDVRFCFYYANGSRDTGTKQHSWGGGDLLHSVLKNIHTINDIDFDKPFKIVNGALCNYKVCPKTHLLIDNTATESIYAKFLNKSSINTLVLTYADGNLFYSTASADVDTGSIRYNRDYTSEYDKINNRFFFGERIAINMTLQNLKVHLKDAIDESNYDCVILRIVDGLNVNVQVFRRK